MSTTGLGVAGWVTTCPLGAADGDDRGDESRGACERLHERPASGTHYPSAARRRRTILVRAMRRAAGERRKRRRSRARTATVRGRRGRRGGRGRWRYWYLVNRDGGARRHGLAVELGEVVPEDDLPDDPLQCRLVDGAGLPRDRAVPHRLDRGYVEVLGPRLGVRDDRRHQLPVGVDLPGARRPRRATGRSGPGRPARRRRARTGSGDQSKYGTSAQAGTSFATSARCRSARRRCSGVCRSAARTKPGVISGTSVSSRTVGAVKDGSRSRT